MRHWIAAACALLAASPLVAQPAAAPPLDLSTAAPIDGKWIYAPEQGGSEATFVNVSAMPQLTVRCARAARQVTISRPVSGAAPFITVWTSTQTRNLPASYKPATGRLEAILGASDPLLDAMAFSRGRAGFGASGQPMLVVPPWPELVRVIEDCRA